MRQELIVNCSPTAKSLPIRAGMRHGVFDRRNIDLRLVSTENSREQRDGLLRGEFQLVHVAIDNAVAMKDVDGADVVVVMGGDSGMNELFVQPHIRSVEEIRGGRLVVDAPDTAFALQAYRIFQMFGMTRDEDYEVRPVGRGELRIAAMAADRANTAAILNLPYSLEARRLGLKSLGDTTEFVGPYQAGSAFVMRPWAEANRNLLVSYISGYLEALAFVLNPHNHEICARILEEDLSIDRRDADESVELLRKPGFGLEPTAAIDEKGFENTLALRAALHGATAADPGSYLDLSFYAQARRLRELEGVADAGTAR